MRALIFGLMISIPFLLFSQDALRITPLNECLGYENYTEEELTHLTRRLERYTLEMTLDSLNALSYSDKVKHFEKLYMNNGTLKDQCLHPDSNLYSIPFDPMEDCFRLVKRAYNSHKHLKDDISRLILNSDNIKRFEEIRGETVVRIWMFTALNPRNDYMLEILLNGRNLELKKYKFISKERDSGFILSLDSQKSQMTNNPDLYTSILDSPSFFEIPGILLLHTDGYKHIIEIKHKDESNFVSVILGNEYKDIKQVRDSFEYLKFIEAETGYDLQLRK